MQGKLDTEKLLGDSGVAWTSIRPVYIYGTPLSPLSSCQPLPADALCATPPGSWAKGGQARAVCVCRAATGNTQVLQTSAGTPSAGLQQGLLGRQPWRTTLIWPSLCTPACTGVHERSRPPQGLPRGFAGAAELAPQRPLHHAPLMSCSTASHDPAARQAL